MFKDPKEYAELLLQSATVEGEPMSETLKYAKRLAIQAARAFPNAAPQFFIDVLTEIDFLADRAINEAMELGEYY